MSVVRRLCALSATVLVASVLVVTPFFTGPAAAAELLQDGGFEASSGSPPLSPNWVETDSAQGTSPGSPLCPSSNCASNSVYTPPRTGSFWARFGGPVGVTTHTASLSQSVTIPSGGTAVLTYWYRNGRVETPFNATLQVRIDGNTLKTHVEAATAESAYTQQTVNIPAQYLNGASHTISFNYSNTSGGDNRMGVDDISLTYTAAVTGTPTVSSTSPASPSSSTTPLVKGTAETGSTVTLYSNSSCSSAALGSGSAAAFSSTGVTATVPANATTTIFAKATKSGQTASACSSTSVSYTNDSVAPGLVTLSSVSPTSPGTSTTPSVKGTAEAGSTVKVYKTGDCSGSPAASGTAAAFAGSGIPVGVTANTSTTFRATATDAAGNASACSTTSLTYVHDSVAPPLVTLTAVTPASPNTSTTPKLMGTAEAGSTVKLYPTAGCTGSPVATGTAAAFASPGLPVTVVLGSITTFRATATDAAGNTSACSTSTRTYQSDLRDGGFEAAVGDPPNSPDWAEADSLAWPLCTTTTCTPGAEIAPHSGNGWAWFGGFPNPGHTGSVSQVVTIPVGSVALNYWYRNSSVSPPYDAVLMVQVDGTTLRTHTEAAVAEPAYTKQVVDLSAFADGNSHVLTFSYVNGGEGVNNMIVDDIGLVPGAAPHTATPVVTATVPASPSTSTTPKVTGTAEAASTVSLYPGAACSGQALGSGTAAEFGAGGITATVPAGATTTIYAKAVKAGQNDSACSTTFARYTHLAPPDTALTKTPKHKVRIAKRKTKVAFSFASPNTAATFECSVDGKAFAACTSGQKFKLKLGKHTFAVRAVAFGLTDATPATYALKVKRRKHR